MFTRFRLFILETLAELKKASWPTWLELRDSTVVVLVAMVILGLIITLFDFSVYSWVQLLTKLVRPA